MPTPMPIMAASSWPKVGTLIPWLMKSMTPKAMATPKRAVRMGRPMAITEPKASSRMMTAARMPTTFGRPEGELLDLGDRRSTELDTKPGPALAVALSIDGLNGVLRQILGLLVELHRPVGDVPVTADLRRFHPGRTGCGRRRRRAARSSRQSVAVMRACTAGDVTGSAVWKTTWASSPACDGKRWASRAWAWADSELPPLNLFSKTPCQTWLTPVTTIRPATHSSTTLRRLA